MIQQINHQLTPHEIEAFKKLPISIQEFVRPRLERPISTFNKFETDKMCLDIITTSFYDNSPNPFDKDLTDDQKSKILDFQSEALKLELRDKYTQLTQSELKTAFKEGIRGKFGNYFGMCPKTYHLFIKSYFELPERGKAWIEYLKTIESESKVAKPVIMTPEFFDKACRDAFEDYKNKATLPFSPVVIYDHTVKMLNLTSLIDKDEWKEFIKKESIEHYKAKIKGNEIAKEWKLDPVENSVFASSVKLIGLKYFYERLIKQCKTI